MYALFIILNDMYLVDDVHEILSRCEVGGTLFNSTGLGKVNMHYNNEDYTFTSIRKILNGNKPKNVTIISIIKSEEKLDEVNKEITKIEYIKYKGEPFMSVVEEKKSINGNDNEVTKTIRSLDSYKIQILGNKESTSEILYVYFKDSTKLICYIDGNKLGVDSGNIWIKDVNIEYIKKQMKDVKIIKEV